jgi:hypothetical protein
MAAKSRARLMIRKIYIFEKINQPGRYAYTPQWMYNPTFGKVINEMAHNSLRLTVAIPLREMYATYCEPSGSGIIGLYSGNFTTFIYCKQSEQRPSRGLAQ